MGWGGLEKQTLDFEKSRGGNPRGPSTYDPVKSAGTLWDGYAGVPPSPEPLPGNTPAPMASGTTTLGTEVL
jgi:hypothetical protein